MTAVSEESNKEHNDGHRLITPVTATLCVTTLPAGRTRFKFVLLAIFASLFLVLSVRYSNALLGARDLIQRPVTRINISCPLLSVIF
jgi:membrane glycosyltransferase